MWSILGVLSMWLLVGTVMIVGEFQSINALLVSEVSGGNTGAGAGTGLGAWGDDIDLHADPPSRGGPQVGIAGLSVLTDTLAMTVTVRSFGAGDLLYEPPVAVGADGRSYPILADSLEGARIAFLDLVTRGQAQASLVFSGAPAGGARLVLIFNPGRRAEDSLTPRVEIPVPMVIPPVPTLAPEETPDG
jgi:hypothetical protein